jgi:RHS repeat-associated protein
MTEVKMKKSTETIGSLVYTRDNDGQVKKTVSKDLPGAEVTENAYDENNRLTKTGTTEYKYDAANNPTNEGSSTNTYNEGDELEKGTGETYAYDELGERTKTTPEKGPATTYGYDQAGNLLSAERPKEGETSEIKDTYAYNGEDLRVSQTINGTTTYLAWDMTEELPLILSDGTNSYIYGPSDLPIEQINNSTGATLYLHHDQQGSTRLLTGSTGKNEGAYTYTPYGAVQEHTGTSTTPLGYDGQYTSSDTGLIYLRARVYDPTTAQFLTVDPALPITRVPYAYAQDNPLTYGDQSGLSALGTLESVGETVVHGVLDVAAVPPYAVYYGSYELARGINSEGEEFGLPGEVIAHLESLPLAQLQALGLSGDVLLDWIKGHTVNNESICDEGVKGYINPFHNFVPGPLKGPEVFLPGIRENGDIDFEW